MRQLLDDAIYIYNQPSDFTALPSNPLPITTIHQFVETILLSKRTLLQKQVQDAQARVAHWEAMLQIGRAHV